MSATLPLTPVIPCGVFFSPAAPAHPLDGIQPRPFSRRTDGAQHPAAQRSAAGPAQLSSSRPPSELHPNPGTSLPHPSPPPSPADLFSDHRFRRSLRSGRPGARSAPPRRETPPPRVVRRGQRESSARPPPIGKPRLYYSLFYVIIPLPYSYHPCSPNKASSFL